MKKFLLTYWGDAVIALSLAAIGVAILLDIPDNFIELSIFLLVFLLMAVISAYRILKLRKHTVREIYYLSVGVAISLATLNLIFHSLSFLTVPVSLMIPIASVVGTARPIIWLYKKWQAKRTPPVQEEEHDG